MSKLIKHEGEWLRGAQMSRDDVIPPTMWVFVPAATREELEEYRAWCAEHLGYTPYMDLNMIFFKEEDHTVHFRLAHSHLI